VINFFLYFILRGLKGVPDQIEVDKKDFLSSLYDNEDGNCSFNTLRYNKEHKGVVFQNTSKRLLNSLYLKFFVDDNLVTCKPYNNSA